MTDKNITKTQASEGIKQNYKAIKELSKIMQSTAPLLHKMNQAEEKLKAIRTKLSACSIQEVTQPKTEEKVVELLQEKNENKIQDTQTSVSNEDISPVVADKVIVDVPSNQEKNIIEKNTMPVEKTSTMEKPKTFVNKPPYEGQKQPIKQQQTMNIRPNSTSNKGFMHKNNAPSEMKQQRKPFDKNDFHANKTKPSPANTNMRGNAHNTQNTQKPMKKPMHSNSQFAGGISRFPTNMPVQEVNIKQQPVKKKTFEKQYTEQKKTTMTKRALVRQQLSVDDFDENKSGYRKMRVAKKQKEQQVQTIKIEHAIVTTENIPLKVLSEKLGITAVEITKRLFKEGIIKTINDSIDYDTAAYIAADLKITLEYRPEKTAEEALIEIYKNQVDGQENIITRPPVVTVMGHVDHGKTSLLDKIRQSNVTQGEAGGITQHIGAYSVKVDGKIITFLDTPGHEAFTAMRARGAMATDIVILVVAADDGIMPQTVEAISHALAAEVPIIVALNKIDKPDIQVDKVKQGLAQHGLTPEEWGGDTIICPISAKTGQGIQELLQTINLVAEMHDLKANPNLCAKGLIIEAKLDKGRGPVASILVQNGTLRIGDSIISGTTIGRVRAMIDDQGKSIKEAGPSIAVSVLGFEEVPNAGDSIIAVEQEKLLKQVLVERKRRESEVLSSYKKNVTLDDVFSKIAEGKLKGLNIIVKADVQGSVEAIKHSLLKLSNEEVRVNIVYCGAGAVTESDVMLADSTNSIIVGFNVRPDTNAKNLIEKNKIDFRSYRIIYELLADIEKALKGMLTPKYQEILMGKCDVLQTFKITGVNLVAGCYVTEGKIVRNGKLRIYRNNILIVEGNVHQLKRFKDDVKEVSGGFECGISIEGFNEIQVGDVIECYIMQEIPV